MEFKRFFDKYEKSIPTIAVDKWVPHPEKKGMLQFAGMRTYGEVFEELKTHLVEMGMIPDEYFSPSYELKYSPKDELPEFSEAIAHVNFGSNEGIYLDVMLASYRGGTPEFVRFATGKTLDCDVEAFYRMNMIAAECSLMLNGRGDRVRLGYEGDMKIEVKYAGREMEREGSFDAASREVEGNGNSLAENAEVEKAVEFLKEHPVLAREIYNLVDRQNHRDDIVSRFEDHEDECLENVTDEEIERIVDSFESTLAKNDGYYEDYWASVDEAIEEFVDGKMRSVEKLLEDAEARSSKTDADKSDIPMDMTIG